MKIRNLSKRQWVITSIVALVLMAAWGAYVLLLRGSATVIPTSDYQVLKPKEFSSRVAVNGSVAPVKTANLYTHLTGPVSALDVRVGDHEQAAGRAEQWRCEHAKPDRAGTEPVQPVQRCA